MICPTLLKELLGFVAFLLNRMIALIKKSNMQNQVWFVLKRIRVTEEKKIKVDFFSEVLKFENKAEMLEFKSKCN